MCVYVQGGISLDVCVCEKIEFALRMFVFGVPEPVDRRLTSQRDMFERNRIHVPRNEKRKSLCFCICDLSHRQLSLP